MLQRTSEYIYIFNSQGIAYYWASLVAQTVRNLSAMQETWVWSLGRERSPGEGKATHSSILAWRIPWTRGAWRATVHGVAELDTTEQLTLSVYCYCQ